MNTASPDILAAVLQQSEVAVLQIDAAQRLVAVHNAQLLRSWMDATTAPDELASVALPQLLGHLWPPQEVASLQQRLAGITAAVDSTRPDIATLAQRPQRSGAAPRQLAVSVQRLAATPEAPLLLVLRDVSATHDLQQALARTVASYDTALTILRTAPDAMRLLLGSAMASVSAIRTTLRMPARTQQALREKLARLQESAEQLGREAQGVALDAVLQSCTAFADALTRLQQQQDISGNDLLPLALLIDNIAGSVGNAWRIEEQRHTLPPAPRPDSDASERRRSRKSASWPQASERRWNEFLRRRGEEIGTLAKLGINGAECVPASLRRDVDEMLQHLLRNAMEHGIETPEQRLAADKPATGQITVKFESGDHDGLKMTVRDDGRGFDVQRIGRAAVNCGLLSEESLLERDAGDLMGLIFKPAFTTEGLADVSGRGRGMTHLRKAVTRCNGQVSVATKAGRYTQFTIQLPVAVAVALPEAQTAP